ncbi:hypothetical protein DOTSEDRAFT_36802 [Dothistroma septosporum NZE10]|uniref:Uncharacterized protein n=1 Tax=Dothistroma septosporum (strain NZE10 / CBS 128990) TaxID=675120 RepID=N1PG94_DOTSN|nr:hypothetical protein DOTSEDRAFT_36802 [Dothistroma septosporum NZE10]
MSDLHRYQPTAVLQSRTSIFQEHLQEDTLMSTHQIDPTTPQSADVSRSLESENASRRGCGLRLTSRFKAKRRKLNQGIHCQLQQESPRQCSFQVTSGRKPKGLSSDSALGSPSTVLFGAASQPQCLEPIPAVRLPGPLLLYPESPDDGLELPQITSMPAMPTYGEPSSPSRIRRGGNNLKRDHPRDGRRFDSAWSCRGNVIGDSFSTELDHCKGETPAPEAWRTALDEQPDVATALCSASQRTASNVIESDQEFDQSVRLPLFGFSQFDIPKKRYAQDRHSKSIDGEQSWTESRSSIDACQEILCRVSGDRDVSYLSLEDGARPSETLAQPICDDSYGPGVGASSYVPYVNIDDDDEPHFPHEWEEKQWLIPRIRSREAS